MAVAALPLGARRAGAWPPALQRPVLLAAPLLAASALLPASTSILLALAAIIVLGIPHGALDGEIARDLVRPRFGRLWFPVFSLPYLALSALVLAGWHLAPLSTLGGFLAASVWHFGSEESRSGSPIELLARGGLPIGLPVLVQPAATAAVFATVAGVPLPQPPAWLVAGALLWLALAALWSVRLVIEREWTTLLAQGLLASAFVILPPLTAFAIYFVGVHAPAHTQALIEDAGRARRVRDGRSAMRHALPLWVTTVLIGAALWPLYDGPTPARLLALTLQGLAALTLPHLVLDAWSSRHPSLER